MALALSLAACRGATGSVAADGGADGSGDGGDSGEGDDGADADGCDVALDRSLRLLTRREYEATVLALIPTSSMPAACDHDDDCALAHESCVAGGCQEDPCPLHTFSFSDPAHAFAQVHVAGSFNGWPSTVADGGWEMQWVASAGAWVTKRALDDGEHAYKLVVDGLWQADPTAAASAPDGFGGENSLLTIACVGATEAPDQDEHPAAAFPVEARVPGFPFDDGVESGLVTSVHVEQYLRAAERLASRLLEQLDAHLPCDLEKDAASCTEQFVRSFGRRAFRRPLDDEEVARYVAIAEAQPDARTGIAVIVRVMLSSPFFLYRFELGAPDAHGVLRLDAYEIAGVLAFSLWGQAPDDALLDAAAAGGLDRTDDIAARARAMLEDPRARDLVGSFAKQWLDVEHVSSLVKNPARHPEFDTALGAAMTEESRTHVVRQIVDGAGHFRDLLLAPTSIVSPALARLYGVDPPAAAQGEVLLPSERRAGILGQAAVLSRLAYADRTSPVRRGVFVLERLLCRPPPPPPADVPSIPEAGGGQTARDVLEQHTADPACAGCHDLIDPIGLSFEHFDAIGGWRDDDNGSTIDARGALRELDGEPASFESTPELAAQHAESRDANACFATQVLRFVGGRLETPEDACVQDSMIDAFAASDGDLRDLFVTTVVRWATAARR